MDKISIDTSAMRLNRLKSANSEDEKLKNACQDFEAVFTAYMLKTMRSTIPQDNSGVSGNQREIFDSMFDQALATKISRSEKSFGLGEALYRDLSGKMK